MSAADVADFVSKIVVHFPVRFDAPEREREWLRALMDALSKYDSDVLTRAANRIIATRTDRRFPLPADIRKACAQIVEDDNRAKLNLRPMKRLEPTDKIIDSRVATADLLINCDVGRMAAKEGWIFALWTYARDHGSLPGSHDYGRLRRVDQEFDEAYRLAIRRAGDARGEDLKFKNKLVQLGESIIARREDLRRRLIGHEASTTS